MAQTVRLWTIDDGSTLRELPPSRLDLESRLEDWLEADISLVENDLLVIGRQVLTDFGGYIDLLCIDPAGDLVILELKRDRTPREIVAQSLDYASWVTELPPARVLEMANRYLGARGPLEAAFSRRFGIELPDGVNQNHRILIVASVIDASSERIIRYLSTVHGVNINAATFQYFRDALGRELLARVFLLEPERVEHSAAVKGVSRRRRLSYEELTAIADERGVGPLYRSLVEVLKPHFAYTRTTGSSIAFKADYQGSRSVMMSLIPAESSVERGVKFQLYAKRIEHRFGMPSGTLAAVLPPGTQEWRYYEGASDDWAGYQGFFIAPQDASRLAETWNGTMPPRED